MPLSVTVTCHLLQRQVQIKTFLRTFDLIFWLVNYSSVCIMHDNVLTPNFHVSPAIWHVLPASPVTRWDWVVFPLLQRKICIKNSTLIQSLVCSVLKSKAVIPLWMSIGTLLQLLLALGRKFFLVILFYLWKA